MTNGGGHHGKEPRNPSTRKEQPKQTDSKAKSAKPKQTAPKN